MRFSLPLAIVTLVSSCIALPYESSSAEATGPYHLHNADGTYNFNAYDEMMDQFDVKYGHHFDSLDTTAEIDYYSFSDAEVAEHHALFKRGAINSFEIVDSGTLGVGNQQLPFYFALYNDYTAVPSSGLTECIAAKSGYSLTSNSKSRKLSGLSMTLNLLNPVNLEVATTIQGSYQLDQFGLGAIGITGPVLAFFGLITYDQFRVRCRAALGMSPHTIATMTFNNQGYAQPSGAFLAAAGASIAGLFVGVAQNLQAQQVYSTHVFYGAPDSSKYSGTLVPIPVSKKIPGKWALDAGSVSVGTYNGVLYNTVNKMGTLILDNQNSFILLPNAIVDEIHKQIHGAGKYGAKGSQNSNIWGIPCIATPQIVFHFNGVTSTFTMTSNLVNVGQAYFGKGVCQSAIQYSNSPGGVLGLPFFGSVYTVFQYNSAGTGYSISLAQSGPAR